MSHQRTAGPPKLRLVVYFEPRRQDRRFAPPIAEVLRVEPGQQGMVRHAWEDLPQPVLGDAEPKPLLQDLRSLLEDDHFQPVADAADIRPRPIRGQGALAHDEDVVAGQISAGLHRLGFDSHLRQQCGGLALGVENRDLRGHRQRGRARHHVDREGVLLRLAAAEA